MLLSLMRQDASGQALRSDEKTKSDSGGGIEGAWI